MRWSEDGFNPLLPLRLAWVNGSFETVLQGQRQPSPNKYVRPMLSLSGKRRSLGLGNDARTSRQTRSTITPCASRECPRTYSSS
jgi:hypothetical protein